MSLDRLSIGLLLCRETGLSSIYAQCVVIAQSDTLNITSFNVIKHVLASLPRDWFLKDYIALFEASESYNGHCDSKNAVGLLAYCNSYDNLKHFEKTV